MKIKGPEKFKMFEEGRSKDRVQDLMNILLGI